MTADRPQEPQGGLTTWREVLSTTCFSVKYGDTQLAVYRVPKVFLWRKRWVHIVEHSFLITELLETRQLPSGALVREILMGVSSNYLEPPSMSYVHYANETLPLPTGHIWTMRFLHSSPNNINVKLEGSFWSRRCHRDKQVPQNIYLPWRRRWPGGWSLFISSMTCSEYLVALRTRTGWLEEISAQNPPYSYPSVPRRKTWCVTGRETLLSESSWVFWIFCVWWFHSGWPLISESIIWVTWILADHSTTYPASGWGQWG